MDKELAELFGFTEEDLEANRSGYLSKAQISMLRKDVRDTLLAFRLAIITVTLCGGFYSLLFISFGDWSAIVPLLIFEIPLLINYRNFNYQAKDSMKAGELQVVEGIVWRDTLISTNGSINFGKHYIGIDGERFFVSRQQFNAFLADVPYRIYFTADKILSCEMVSSPEIINA